MITLTDERLGTFSASDKALEDVWHYYAIGYCADDESFRALRMEVAAELKKRPAALAHLGRFELAVILASIPGGG